MYFRPLAAAALLAVSLLAAPSAAQTQRQWFADGPTPTRYEIAVTPDADAGTFTGETRITIQSSEQLATVVMNALDIEVARATIDNQGAAFDIDNEAQTLTLTPRRPLRPGRHTIRIVYSGKIYDDAYGLFRVEYQDNGQTKRALATQFEPGDARRLAPMWDQPNRRAVFSLTVTAPTNQMVVSNMPEANRQSVSAGRTRTRFADTPSMPSYLLFLAVGDFERVTRDVDGIELGVVVRRGEGHRAGVALQAGEESLRYFQDYFGIRYPLPKLDMIGVPGAGGFGAMENWGAILYFDQYLLVDEQGSSEADRQTVFGFVAHEIAHQWFGNLVTMMWWDDLWLNEGFASWMAAKAVEARHPDWQPWLSQLTDGAARAMALDSRAGTHPVVQTVNTIDDANLAFDEITYEKGLAVIRMLEAYVGEENFRRGVRDYLNAHLYDNAQTEDLWRAVQTASGQPVLEIAHSFTRQPGFPLVTANAPLCRRGEPLRVSITQRRFAMDDAARTNELWSIPVVARTLGAEPVRVVLPAQANASIDLASCGPYLVNADQSGFFRTLYDHRNFSQLASAFASLDAIDQQGLLGDYYAFGRSGDAPFTNYMQLVSALPADADPVLVMDVATSLQAFAGYTQGRPNANAVRQYALQKLRPHFERVGWEARTNDRSNDILMRASLIGALGALGDEAIIAEARRRVRESESSPAALPAPIRSATIGVYAQHATTGDYAALLARARAATDFVEQRRLWLLLASAKDETLARRTLQMTLGDMTPRQIRTQVLQGVATAHPRMGWDFLVTNRVAFEQLLDPLQRLEFPTDLAALNSDPEVAMQLQAYARNFPEGARGTVDAAVAQIRLNAQTRDRMSDVERFIAEEARAQRVR